MIDGRTTPPRQLLLRVLRWRRPFPWFDRGVLRPRINDLPDLFGGRSESHGYMVTNWRTPVVLLNDPPGGEHRDCGGEDLAHG